MRGTAVVPRRARLEHRTWCAASIASGYRPLAVLQPSGGAPAWSMELECFAADQDVAPCMFATSLPRSSPTATSPSPLTPGCLADDDPHRRRLGARAVRALPGSITFRGGRDCCGRPRRAACDAARPITGPWPSRSPSAPSGRCPHELAISPPRACASVAEARCRDDLAEAGPLEAFGAEASSAAAEPPRGLATSSSSPRARAIAADAGQVQLEDGRRIQARAVITLPDLVGRRVHGRPQDAAGFIAVTPTGGCSAPTASTPPATSPRSPSSRAAWPPSRPTPPSGRCSPPWASPSCRAVRARPQGRPLHRSRAGRPGARPTAGVRSPARTRCGGREQDRRGPSAPYLRSVAARRARRRPPRSTTPSRSASTSRARCMPSPRARSERRAAG